jgi:ubiquitin
MFMKKLINYIAKKVWNEVGVSLNEGIHTKESLKATYKVVSDILGESIAEELLINLLEAKDDKVDPDTEVTYKNKDGEKKTTTYKTAISSDKESPQYKAADTLRNTNDTPEEKEDDAKFSKSDQIGMMTQIEKDAQANTDDNESQSKEQANGYVGDKDKALKQGDPRESEVYQMELPPDDVEFEEKNKKFANPNPPEPYKMPDFLNDNPKFPKKYTKALERMLNTQPKGDATKWGHFSDIEGGAGQISAQAGELMTMMGSTMSDEEWDEFSNSILKHDDAFNEANPKLKNAKNKIVDKSWVKAATQSRKAIKDRLTKQYGDGVEIVAGAWDTQSDVEAMGLSDYGKNKGFSTDMYLKVRKPDGTEVMDEVSLKKSTKVNFLNSGAGEFSKWDKNLPDEINQSVYRDKARARNISVVNENRAEIEKLLKSPEGTLLNDLLKSKKMNLDEALQGNSRAKQKVLWTAINQLAKNGNKSAQSTVDADDKEHRKFQADSITAITENPKMKEGMLNTIKNEFPLKAVSDGEETMAIGPNSLDKSTMETIFGTSDYSKLKENLVAEDGPPPFIGYKVEKSGEVFAIADIVIREDGRGYGGQFKFEMQLNQKSFAKRLEQAQSEVYGK